MRWLRFLLLLMIIFIFQTAGIRDGPPHCAKNLSVFNDNLDTSGINDAEVIIKIDISRLTYLTPLIPHVALFR
jgi:hypothetical protein